MLMFSTRPGSRRTSLAKAAWALLTRSRVRFYGSRGEGFRALTIAVQRGLPVRAVRRPWAVDEDSEPHGVRVISSYSRGFVHGRIIPRCLHRTTPRS